MDVKLSFEGYNNCYPNNTHIASMINGDEKNTLHMSIWQKIKDFFRTEKRSDAYQALYHLLHDTEGSDKLSLFNKLKIFANPEHQDFFSKDIYCNEIVFFVNNEKIAQSSLQKIMNISKHVLLEEMSMPEKNLFLKMLDTLKEKELLYKDSHSGFIREKVSNEHCNDLYNLYRPEEEVGSLGTELVNVYFLVGQEEELLRHLNPQSGVVLSSQFSNIGYQNTPSGVEFCMQHPSISYLLNAYSASYAGEPSTDYNSECINKLNKIYRDYNFYKSEIDPVLHRIYQTHSGTLNIFCDGHHDNRMVPFPDGEKKYHFQSNDNLKDISDLLDGIYYKWTSKREGVA